MPGSRSIPFGDRLTRWMIIRRLRGVGTLCRFFGRFVTANAVTATKRYGSSFVLRPNDYIDRIVLSEGFYESEVLDALLNELPSGGVLWDVGANFGLHGVTAKVRRPDIRVVCFEPSPESAVRVLERAALNGVTRRCRLPRVGGRTRTPRAVRRFQGLPGHDSHGPMGGS